MCTACTIIVCTYMYLTVHECTVHTYMYLYIHVHVPGTTCMYNYNCTTPWHMNACIALSHVYASASRVHTNSQSSSFAGRRHRTDRALGFFQLVLMAFCTLPTFPRGGVFRRGAILFQFLGTCTTW